MDNKEIEKHLQPSGPMLAGSSRQDLEPVIKLRLFTLGHKHLNY